MRTDLALAAAALLGVGALHALAAWTEPDLVTLREAASREGARVAIEGRVLRAVDGARARFLTLADDEARMDAFAPLSPPLSAGDTVRLVGIVTRLESGLGLSADELEVVAPYAARLLSPADLARRPEAYEGARVAVVGDLREGALAGDGARIDARGEEPPARTGRFVATGAFRYHESDARYVLWVETWTRPS